MRFLVPAASSLSQRIPQLLRSSAVSRRVAVFTETAMRTPLFTKRVPIKPADFNVSPAAPLFAPIGVYLHRAKLILPKLCRALINPRDFILFAAFLLLYKRALRLLYQLQGSVFKLIRPEQAPEAKPFEQSWLGFIEPRLRTLSRVLAGIYITNGEHCVSTVKQARQLLHMIMVICVRL